MQAPDKAPETCTWSTRSEGGRNLQSRNLDGNQIAWKYRRCAGHANLLFRDGVKRQVGKCDCLLEFTIRPELSQSRARIWPQQHVPKRLKNSGTRNSTARSQNRRLAIWRGIPVSERGIPVSEHLFAWRTTTTAEEFRCQSIFSRGGRPRRRGSRTMPRRWEMTSTQSSTP